MNQLDFSPISEKDEQSLDTFSFLHKQCQSNRSKYSYLVNEGCKKLFDRLQRSVHNRKSYGLQLLKQFILFSSDEETIQIHYKYMHYELEQGVSHLQNTYGLRFKLTLGKAFEDIRNFSRKKKAYENPVFVHRLVSVYDKVLNLTKQQSYRSVIKVLAKYIQKQVISNQGPINQESKKNTFDLIQSLEKQIQDENNQMREKRISNEQITREKQSDLKCTKKQDFFKTTRFAKMNQSNQENSRWKEEVESVDSYEEQAENEQPRVIIKSMSNQIHDYPYSTLSAISSRDRKLAENKSRQTKCMSISVTPVRPSSDQYIFQTKKKKSSGSVSKNSSESNQKIVQNVVIIRGSKTKRRQPDRFIRVPVVSDEVKIVEMIPETDKKKSSKYKGSTDYGLNKINLKHLESSKHEQRRNYRVQNKYKKQVNYNFSKLGESYEGKEYEDSETHECIGCKYCQVVRDMESYRMQRTSRMNQVFRLI